MPQYSCYRHMYTLFILCVQHTYVISDSSNGQIVVTSLPQSPSPYLLQDYKLNDTDGMVGTSKSKKLLCFTRELVFLERRSSYCLRSGIA
jgi:hypothetical protein